MSDYKGIMERNAINDKKEKEKNHKVFQFLTNAGILIGSRCWGGHQIVRRTEKVFATYSWRNSGQHIYICMDCFNNFLKLVEENEK